MTYATLIIETVIQIRKQWGNLHPMERARLKHKMLAYLQEAVSISGVDAIPTPCVVNAHVYFKDKPKGPEDFDNLAIAIGKLFIDPLCPDKINMTKSGWKHRVGLGLIPDDTMDHIVAITITRHPHSGVQRTVLHFDPPGERYHQVAEAARKAREERYGKHRKGGKKDVNPETSPE